MTEEKLTLWVQLSGEDRLRALEMKSVEKRSGASLLRKALEHYYKSAYLPSQEILTK